MADEPFRGTAQVLRRNWGIFAAALALLVLAPPLFLLGLLGHLPVVATIAEMMFFGGALATAYVSSKNPNPRVVEGVVDADREGVSFDGAMLLRREAIHAGFLVPRSGLPPMVRLEPKGMPSPLEIVVNDEEQGRALLGSLSLGASKTVMRFPLRSRSLTNGAYRVASTIGIAIVFARTLGYVGTQGHVGAQAASALAFGAITLVFLLSLLVAPGWIGVGADGLVFSWLGRKRFVGYGDLQTFKRYGDGSENKRSLWGLKLVLRSGEEIRMPVGLDDSRMAAITDRIDTAVETFRRGDASADTAVLKRGARDVSGWIRSLRTIGAGANATLRTAPIEADRLWRIVEDPSVDASARAGAAVALRDDLDAPGKLRLRAVAEAVAERSVRSALEAAADDVDEEALIEALGQIEAEDRRPKNSA